MATMLADTVEAEPDRFDLSSLRVGFLGGAPCAPALLARTRRVLRAGPRRRDLRADRGRTTISVDPGDGSCGDPGETVGRIVSDLCAVVVAPGTRTASR